MKKLKTASFIKLIFLLGVLFNHAVFAQTLNRTFSGTVVTQQFELVPNVTVEVQTSGGSLQTVTDSEGNFSLRVPSEPLSVKFFGKNINPVTRIFAVTDTLVGLQIKISYVLSSI